MKKKYYFISGLPRSGSTLLTSILNQNPKFHSEISGAICDLMFHIMHGYSSDPSFNVICPNERMRNSIGGLIDGYYSHIEKNVIFDTNRGWTRIPECLYELNSNFKVVCMVRDYVSVLNSFEILYKKRGFIEPISVYQGNTSNVYVRTDYLANNSFLRFSYNSLREAYFGPYRKHLLFVEYIDLAKKPKETMERIYDFIEEPKFKHNFNNVSYSNEEYDRALRHPHLHSVRPTVKFEQTPTILPPDLYQKYINWEFWR